MSAWPIITDLGDHALLIEYEPVIDVVRNQQLHALAKHVGGLFPGGITDCVPSYHSLAVFYRPERVTRHAIEQAVRAWQANGQAVIQAERIIDVPVCYDAKFATDLEALADYCQLSVSQVIALHTAPDYHVHFLGFKPGFAYLGGLDSRLCMPRHATPRLALPAGAVGIGGAQTGIYPQAGPGGWQIIGRTPMALFAPDNNPPCRLQPGDRLRFISISLDDYFGLGGAP